MNGKMPIVIIAGAAALIIGRKKSQTKKQNWDHSTEVSPPYGLILDERPLCGFLLSSNSNDVEACLAPSEWSPRGIFGVPMAKGSPEVWPVETDHPGAGQPSYYTVNGMFRGKWGRHFGARRERPGKLDARHAGMDLSGRRGDLIVASQPGMIIAILPFYKGTWSVYVKTDDGIIINYGEIEKGSWSEFGRKVGDQLASGTPIARIGHHEMLHLEIYEAEENEASQISKIRSGKYKWQGNDTDAPEGLLDPTEYLIKAQISRSRAESMDGEI